MFGGTVKVKEVQWGARTVTFRGDVWFMDEPAVFTLAYRRVSVTALALDGVEALVRVIAGTEFVLGFENNAAARDIAAELQRRMEAVHT